MCGIEVSLLNGHLRFSRTLAQRLGVLIVLLAVDAADHFVRFA